MPNTTLVYGIFSSIARLWAKEGSPLTRSSSGAKPELMTTTTKKLIQSFIIVPLVATTLSMNTFTASINEAVLKATSAEETLSPEAIALQKERESKAAKIDAYYAQYGLPLAGYGMQMVITAEKHSLDWRLLPAIAMRESTGCKFIIKSHFNCFGFGTAKFQSFDEGIEMVGSHIGGANPRTAKYYANKPLKVN